MSPATQDVFENVIARPVATRHGHHPCLVHLWWSAPDQGPRLVQVYVNDQLTDVTTDPTQRQLWLMIDRTRPQRIELLAVPALDPDAAWRPQPESLTHWDPPVTDHATLTVIRDERLPVDTRLQVHVDGQPTDRGPMWPASQHRGGFGALLGLGEFGRDAVTGPGLGLGQLGMGPLGSEGTAWRWRRDDLTPGSHDLTVTATDHRGRTVAQPLTAADTGIDALPPAAETFTIDTAFTLAWTA